jgi:hypothetical protein
MLFGNRKPKPGGLLGTLAMAEPAPDRMAMFDQPAQPAQTMQPMAAQGQMDRFLQPHEAAGPSFFGQGGTGRHIAGSLGDALMQMGGLQPTYAPAMQYRQQMNDRRKLQAEQLEAERASKQQERMDSLYAPQKMGDNMVRLNPKTMQYETIYTAPRYNDTEADAALLDQRFGKGAGDQYLRNLGDPTVTVPLSNGMVYTGPRSGLGAAMQGQGGGGGLNPGDVEDGYRFKGGNPADRNNWEPVGGGAGNGTGSFRPVGKATGFQSYQSGSYGPLEEAAGREFGVPPEMLFRVRTKGEKSNANQVSEVGARSVYQVTPETRALIQKQYGFDPWSSPQNAARGAAIVLRDMKRKFGNWDDAMTGYHGGSDTRNWGPRTRAYRQRTRTNRGN